MLAVCATPHLAWPEEQPLIDMGHSEDYELSIRQQPRDALLAQDGKEKSESRSNAVRNARIDASFAGRKPVDPPPVVQVSVRDAADPTR